MHGWGDIWLTETEKYNSIEVPSIEKDSSKIVIRHTDEAYMTQVHIPNTTNIISAKMNHSVVFQNNPNSPKPMFLELLGMTQDSLMIELEKVNPSTVSEIAICTHYKKLPVKDEIPDVAVRAEGFSSVVQEISY